MNRVISLLPIEDHRAEREFLERVKKKEITLIPYLHQTTIQFIVRHRVYTKDLEYIEYRDTHLKSAKEKLIYVTSFANIIGVSIIGAGHHIVGVRLQK